MPSTIIHWMHTDWTGVCECVRGRWAEKEKTCRCRDNEAYWQHIDKIYLRAHEHAHARLRTSRELWPHTFLSFGSFFFGCVFRNNECTVTPSPHRAHPPLPNSLRMRNNLWPVFCELSVFVCVCAARLRITRTQFAIANKSRNRNRNSFFFVRFHLYGKRRATSQVFELCAFWRFGSFLSLCPYSPAQPDANVPVVRVL